jgi:hypothetical protein
MSNQTWETTGFWVSPCTSPYSLFFHVSANKIPLIFTCVPAFDFYPTVEQGPSLPKNFSVTELPSGSAQQILQTSLCKINTTKNP